MNAEIIYMVSIVKLFFSTSIYQPLNDLIPSHKIIRLKCLVQFETTSGWSKSYEAIVDTGGHTSVIPYSIWKKTKYKRISEYKISGLSPKPECAIPVIIGKNKCVIVDDLNNCTKEYIIHAFLALTDEIPLIIGFIDILQKFAIHFNYEINEAYIEERH